MTLLGKPFVAPSFSMVLLLQKMKNILLSLLRILQRIPNILVMKMAILMLFTKSLHSSNDISMIILIVGFQVSARFWEALCIADVFFFLESKTLLMIKLYMPS